MFLLGTKDLKPTNHKVLLLVLGFILYKNNLVSCTKSLRFINFPDDFALYFKDEFLSGLAVKFSTEMWLQVETLFINISKILSIFFSPSQLAFRCCQSKQTVPLSYH